MRKFALYSLYFGPIALGSMLLIRSIVSTAKSDAEAPALLLPCDAVVATLEEQALSFYSRQVRELGKDLALEPLPGELKTWESTRLLATERCPAARAQLKALLVMRRALQNNLLLLHAELAAPLGELHPGH